MTVSVQGKSTNAAILEIQEFETAFPVSPAERDEVLRRFSTLFIDSSTARRSGSNGFVTRAINAFGEEFAVKRLRIGAEATPTIDMDPPHATERSLAAFRTEFEGQLALANIKGFPKLYGYGKSGSTPLIVMEWIEGVSLSELIDSTSGGSRLDRDFAIRIGAVLFESLARLDGLVSRPVHRDLSPGNVMIRTSQRSIEEQAASDELDLCIIDFGSTTVLDKQDPRFTTVTSIMRHATPEYAPPEMLTDTLPNVLELRQSPAIDVYAACSIMYELLSGKTPFALVERPDEIPYLVKTSTLPDPLDIPGYENVCELIMSGLAVNQAERPAAKELRDAFFTAAGESIPSNDQLMLPSPKAKPGTILHVPEDTNSHLGVKDASFGRVNKDDVVNDRGLNSRKDRILGLPRRNFFKVAVVIVAAIAIFGAAGMAALSGSDGKDDLNNDSPAVVTSAYTGGSLYTAQDEDSKLWGYVNSQRQWVIEPRFKELPGLFSEGFALVKDEESGFYGYIGEDGEWKIEPAFSSANTFGEGRAFVKRVVDGNGDDQYSSDYGGWIDTDGNWVIEPAFVGGGIFSNGLCTAINESTNTARWGYIDEFGNWVIEPSFMNVGPFADNGLALASLHVGQFGWIKRDGSWAIEPRYAKASSFSEGLAPYADVWSEKWGFVDEAGAIVIDAQFDSARLFKAGLAACKDASSGLWGFVDEKGDWRIDPQFERAGDFLHGLAAAQDADNHLFGYIDDTGYWVIPPQYASVNLSVME